LRGRHHAAGAGLQDAQARRRSHGCAGGNQCRPERWAQSRRSRPAAGDCRPARAALAGLQAYHGGAQHLRSAEERKTAIEQVLKLVNRTRHEFDRAGLTIPLITGAGTGTMVNEAASGIYGEIQPGSFLFMDADYAANQRDAAQPLFEHALYVKTQVMSLTAITPSATPATRPMP
jgi:D-serine deaminase-like pyridoxal phosphate-dependent protein